MSTSGPADSATTTGPVWSFSVGPPSKAFRPMPWNGMKAVATNVGTLKWVAGESATTSSNAGYFGTDATLDADEFKGNQSGTTFNPGPLSPGVTYYWRVDQVNAQGTMTGDVWSFTTPINGANRVKVFILAGQSNMEGQGEVNPSGTKGTLQYIYNNDPVTYAHLKNGSRWAVRDDAWIWPRRIHPWNHAADHRHLPDAEPMRKAVSLSFCCATGAAPRCQTQRARKRGGGWPKVPVTGLPAGNSKGGLAIVDTFQFRG